MGRPCECCGGGIDECKNIHSRFSTPWVVGTLVNAFSDITEINSTFNSLSGHVNIKNGLANYYEVDCEYYRTFLPTAPTQRACFNCPTPPNTDPPGAIVSNPFGVNFWCGYGPSFPIIYPEHRTNIYKVFKIKSGSYTVNINGFDTAYVQVAFGKSCFDPDNRNCNNTTKTFPFPTFSGSEYVVGTITSGPSQYWVGIDNINCISTSEYVSYPYDLSNGGIGLFGSPVNFSQFTFNVPEDCFFYLSITGIKYPQTEVTSMYCSCNGFIMCPPRTIHALKSIEIFPIESHDFNISIAGDVEEINTPIKYVQQINQFPLVEYICHD